MTTPPTGPKQPDKPEPLKPSKPVDKKDEYLLNSPFAKMFKATGVMPTPKEIQAIINGILKGQISAIKKQDESWKKSMQKMKKAILGDD